MESKMKKIVPEFYSRRRTNNEQDSWMGKMNDFTCVSIIENMKIDLHPNVPNSKRRSGMIERKGAHKTYS